MMRGVLSQAEIAYETWGELSAARDNAVLLFTGLSPSAHAASSPLDPTTGWWEDMLGPDKPIDTNRHFVVCVNSLGSCFGSTGPASIDPAAGQPYRLSFPMLCLEDIANAGHAVIESLGVSATACRCRRLHGRHDRPGVRHAASGRRHGSRPHLLRRPESALLHRHALAAAGDGAFRSRRGAAANTPPTRRPRWACACARKLGMISYRSSAEWTVRFGRERATDEPACGKPSASTSRSSRTSRPTR